LVCYPRVTCFGIWIRHDLYAWILDVYVWGGGHRRGQPVVCAIVWLDPDRYGSIAVAYAGCQRYSCKGHKVKPKGGAILEMFRARVSGRLKPLLGSDLPEKVGISIRSWLRFVKRIQKIT